MVSLCFCLLKDKSTFKFKIYVPLLFEVVVFSADGFADISFQMPVA